MPWRKAPPALIALFQDAIPKTEIVEHRKMFGYPAAFIGGHLFAGLHQENFILRLSESDRADACGNHGASIFEPMPGRKMREYVTVPEAVLANRRVLETWIRKSLQFAEKLPAKVQKRKKPLTKARPKNRAKK